MQINSKTSFDDANPSRDHRERTAGAANDAVSTTPGTKTERPVAGGATPVSRPEQEATRDSTADGQKVPETLDNVRDLNTRRRAEQALSQVLDLPNDTRVAIDVEDDVVRFQLRDIESGRVIREIPADESQTLLDKLRDFSGALIDKSL